MGLLPGNALEIFPFPTSHHQRSQDVGREIEMDYQVNAVFSMSGDIWCLSLGANLWGQIEASAMERVSRAYAQMADFPTCQLSLRLPGPGAPRKLLASLIQVRNSVAPPPVGLLSSLISVQPQFPGKVRCPSVWCPFHFHTSTFVRFWERKPL